MIDGPTIGMEMKRRPAEESLLVQRCIQPLSSFDPDKFKDFSFAEGTKLGDAFTMNNFQRVQLLYHEAGSWLERDFFAPNKVDVKVVEEALVGFSYNIDKHGRKTKMSIDGERWRQIMRMIIGWHSELLDS